MKISFCVITKNEEKNIKKCIESVKNIVDEIVVIDTGSTDNTVNIAKGMGAKVHHFEWIDDFAAARNYALSKVNGKWIIFLDADEYFEEDCISKVRDIIRVAEGINADIIETEWVNINQTTGELQSILPVIRILKKSPLIRYKGKIHETVHKLKGKLIKLDAYKELKIFHVGYSTDIILEKDKADRNIQLLYKQLQSNNENSNIHFYLAGSFNLKQNKEKVLEHAEKVFKYNNGTLTGIYQQSYVYRLNSMIDLKYIEDEVVNVYTEAIKFDSTYPDFEISIGNYYLLKNNYHQALHYFNKCIEKMNVYSGKAESWVIAKAKDVYRTTGYLYYVTENYNECTRILINVLNIYKDDLESLTLLLQVLYANMSLQQVHSIISKIYDGNSDKDKILILKACIKLGNKELAEYLKEKLVGLEYK